MPMLYTIVSGFSEEDYWRTDHIHVPEPRIDLIKAALCDIAFHEIARDEDDPLTLETFSAQADIEIIAVFQGHLIETPVLPSLVANTED